MTFPSSQNILHDLKGTKVKYNLHYRRVRGAFLRLPHGTTSSCSNLKMKKKNEHENCFEIYFNSLTRFRMWFQ